MFTLQECIDFIGSVIDQNCEQLYLFNAPIDHTLLPTLNVHLFNRYQTIIRIDGRCDFVLINVKLMSSVSAIPYMEQRLELANKALIASSCSAQSVRTNTEMPLDIVAHQLLSLQHSFQFHYTRLELHLSGFFVVPNEAHRHDIHKVEQCLQSYFYNDLIAMIIRYTFPRQLLIN